MRGDEKRALPGSIPQEGLLSPCWRTLRKDPLERRATTGFLFFSSLRSLTESRRSRIANRISGLDYVKCDERQRDEVPSSERISE